MGLGLARSAAAFGAAVLGTAAIRPALGAASIAQGDIRDIRGPRAVEDPWMLWAAAAAGAIVAALLAYAAWRWIRRRRAALPDKPDFEVALERLEAARALMGPGRGREFSIEVSGIVREFIEKRFAVRAAHRTTNEFLHDSLVSADPGLTGHRQLLGEFLQSCDLAKFGGWSLSPGQMAAMLEGACRFVRSAAAPPATRSERAAEVASPPDEDKPRVSLPSA